MRGHDRNHEDQITLPGMELQVALDATILRRKMQAKQFDQEELAVWRDDFRMLAEECGTDRVIVALRQSWTRVPYLPNAAQIRELLPEPDPLADSNVKHCDQECTQCHGSGWTLRDLGETRVAERCDCHHAQTMRKPSRSVSDPSTASQVQAATGTGR
jgi:hypothetical protein